MEIYEKIQHLLIGNHIDFKIGDTDVLQQAEVKGEEIKIGKSTVKMIVVPPMRVIEEPLQKLLENLKDRGIPIIFVENKFIKEDFIWSKRF